MVTMLISIHRQKSIAYNASIDPKKYYFHDTVQYPYHNLKQNRTYQVGFVLSDRYGRQSDVILSSYDSVENLAGSTVYSPYRRCKLSNYRTSYRLVW